MELQGQQVRADLRRAIGKGTEFASTNRGMAAQFDLRPKGFMKLMMPLMAGAIRKDFPRQLKLFKEFFESSADA